MERMKAILAIEWKDYGRDELVVVEKIIGVSVLCANRRPNERQKVVRERMSLLLRVVLF